MNNKGFTLMEILLAAMIVGVIGVALAALTTAAVREGGVGRTRTMLRHQLSMALYQLHQDIAQSTRATISNVTINNVSYPNAQLVLTQEHPLEPNQNLGEDAERTITYTFTPGNVQGAGNQNSLTGGTYMRQVDNGAQEIWLDNVKSINNGIFYSPSFAFYNGGTNDAALRVRIIVEMPTSPVINDVVEEVFMLPNGFMVSAN